MQTIKLSYIIPFYLGEATIHQCIKSIYDIGIEEDELEVIVVDDHSPNMATEILSDNLRKHKNMRVIRHETNKRQGGAKNTGIRAAQGEYIAFADQDDVIATDNVKGVLDIALQAKTNMVACHYMVRYENDVVKTFGIKSGNGTITSGKSFCETYFDPSVNLAPWAYLYERDFLMRVAHPYEENVVMEDSDWVAWHLIHADSIAILNTAIYCWCMNPRSITHSQHYINRADWIKIGYRKIRDAELYQDISEPFSLTMTNDGRFNIIGGMRKVWKVDNYLLFYRRLYPILPALQKMNWNGRVKFLLNNPKMSICLLYIIGTFLKLINYARYKLSE